MSKARYDSGVSGGVQTEGDMLPFDTTSILKLSREGKIEDIKKLANQAIEAGQPGFVLYNYGDLKRTIGEEEADKAISKAATVNPTTTIRHLENYIDSSKAEEIFKDAIATLPDGGKDGLSKQGFLTTQGEGKLFALDVDKVKELVWIQTMILDLVARDGNEKICIANAQKYRNIVPGYEQALAIAVMAQPKFAKMKGVEMAT